MLDESFVGQLCRQALKAHGASATKRPRYRVAQARLGGFAKLPITGHEELLRLRKLRGNKSNRPWSLCSL